MKKTLTVCALLATAAPIYAAEWDGPTTGPVAADGK